MNPLTVDWVRFSRPAALVTFVDRNSSTKTGNRFILTLRSVNDVIFHD